ncbi:uncharacterized protein HD556DRAFT_1443419 [Suillus plorans]|uniref:Uncharacterized protein n=1 Tax=Suillus plorans TaxID=116603 RepID=A0A9P7AR22_9AGAM|nr:uncharacterized protein HD556DRAFT_1443419 [Suillus plorans]KAG1793633.1 hypothetical protein HD556DRAFT_1443419 [Suillus plorans]
MVQRTHLLPTIKFTKDRGYDVKPGDLVRVVRGPEYQTTGVIQSVNIPNTRLTILSDSDHTLIDVPIGFVLKLCNTSVDKFKHVINKEVFIIGGSLKGYRATLCDIGQGNCTVAIHGQKRTVLKRPDVVTSYGMRLNSLILEEHDLLTFCDIRTKSYVKAPSRGVTPPPEKIVPLSSNTDAIPSSSNILSHWTSRPEDIDIALNQSPNINPSSASDPWTTHEDDIQDSPLPWLMKKEFSSVLLKHHALFKVSLSFDYGRLSKRFISTACPDPFYGANGPAPEGCVAAFCTSNGAGAQIIHYHIPASDLSPAHPRKKNQLCLILDGEYRGLVLPVAKCNKNLKTVEILMMASSTITFTLHFNQICLVEPSVQYQ